MYSSSNESGVSLGDIGVLDNSPQQQEEPINTQETNSVQEPMYFEIPKSHGFDDKNKLYKRLVRKRKFREVKRNIGYVLTIIKTAILIITAILIFNFAVSDGVRGRIVKSVETVAHTVEDWFTGKYTTEKGKTTKDYVDDLVKDLDKVIGYEEN